MIFLQFTIQIIGGLLAIGGFLWAAIVGRILRYMFYDLPAEKDATCVREGTINPSNIDLFSCSSHTDEWNYLFSTIGLYAMGVGFVLAILGVGLEKLNDRIFRKSSPIRMTF